MPHDYCMCMAWAAGPELFAKIRHDNCLRIFKNIQEVQGINMKCVLLLLLQIRKRIKKRSSAFFQSDHAEVKI